MLTILRPLLNGLRLRLFRTSRSFSTWLEPRDPGHLASRLERGDLVWRAFAEAGTALRRCGRWDEADRMLERGLGAFPADPTLLFEYAMAAHNSGRYAQAVARWERALQASPDRAMCHCGLAANLRESGELARAQAVVDAALAGHPDDLVVVSEAARIADARGLFGRSLPLWTRAAKAPDAPADWLISEAQALIALGRLAEAEVALDAARIRFPQSPGLLAIEASLADERNDWPTAARCWSAYLAHFPEDRTARRQLDRAEARATTLGGRRARDAAPGQSDKQLRTLLLGFESIGDGCEFDMVQRRFAAEAPGLLSCNIVSFDGLIAALEQRFAGMGDPANTDLTVAADGEFLLADRRWGLARRTGAYEGQTAGDGLRGTVCRQVTELRERLISDLTAAAKIVVFRSEGLDGDRLALLHRKLRAFGPVRLLNVQPAAPTAPTFFEGRAGDILTVGQDLHVGFVERLGTRASSGRWDIAVGDWVSICAKAAAQR